MSLLESPALKIVSSPLKSVSLDSQAYVLSLASLQAYYAASASAPSNAIHLFDKSSLQNVTTLSGHENATTSLQTVESLAGRNSPVLVSSGKDGTVKAWDERTASVALKMTTAGRALPLLCCDLSYDGLTVAAGTDLQGDDALILYWDPRNPAAPLRTHASTHSDDITTLHFLSSDSPAASSSHKILLSASSDGLISTSNAEEEDEDEAVTHVGNWGCSISQAGWIHTNEGPQIWAASDMETFSAWSGELDLVRDLDIRHPSVHNEQHTWVTDYLIGCHSSVQSSSADFKVFIGSNEGDVALISNSDLSDSSAPWSLHRLWSTGHVGVVRSLLWDERSSVLVTGGEDSKINAWSFPSLNHDIAMSDSTSESRDDSMDIDGDSTSSRKRDRNSGIRRGANIDQGTKRARRV